MNLKPKAVAKLAGFTRQFDWARSPFMHKFCRGLLRRVYPRGKQRKPCELVVEYDRGLLNVNTSSLIEYRILFDGAYEPAVLQVIRAAVKPGSVCLDVGANVGTHTLPMAFAAGPEGRVIAVEPHPDIAARLRRNIALNRLQNVSVIEAAVSDKNGVATLYGYDSDNPSQGISSLKPGNRRTREICVRTLSGSALLAEAGIARCDFLKIDVEGADMVVLRQLSHLFGSLRPHVVFEHEKKNWDRFGASIDEAVELFRESHYDLYVIRKNLIQPLEGPVPDSCEVFCVPSSDKPSQPPLAQGTLG